MTPNIDSDIPSAIERDRSTLSEKSRLDASLISEVVRTGQCVPGSVLEVAHIDAVIRVSSTHRAVRLILWDGQHCIQTLLSAAAHRLVDDGVICRGCRVRLDSFGLRVLEPEGDGRVKATVFLRVDKLCVVSEPDHVEVKSDGDDTAVAKADGRDQQASVAAGAHTASDEEEPPEFTHPHNCNDLEAAAQDRNHRPNSEEAADGGGAAEQSHRDDAPTMGTPQQPQPQPPPPPAMTLAVDKSWSPLSEALSAGDGAKALPWTAPDIRAQPLKLTALRAIPHLPYRQNWTVNVLAVVASLSAVEPSQLPSTRGGGGGGEGGGGLQRTARLADPSTSKQVLLTVFLDPEAFSPRVGAVVLLAGVKNHPFDGGSLKKYASDRPRGGNPWWLEDPAGRGWYETAALEAWWAAGQVRT